MYSLVGFNHVTVGHAYRVDGPAFQGERVAPTRFAARVPGKLYQMRVRTHADNTLRLDAAHGHLDVQF